MPGSGRSAGEGIGYPLHYSWASLVALLIKNPPAMQETWVPSLGWEDPLEKGKATHSSVLAWRIPWTVESMRSQRVGHDAASFTFTDIIISFIGNNGHCNIKHKARYYNLLWFCFLHVNIWAQWHQNAEWGCMLVPISKEQLRYRRCKILFKWIMILLKKIDILKSDESGASL